jgi:hypothetical protein
MGNGSRGMNGPDGGKAYEPQPDDVESQIADIRGQLDDLVGELDRRRHDLFDWRRQLDRHRRELALGAGAAAVVVVGAVALRRRRRRGRFGEAQQLLHALGVVAQHPRALERALRPHEPDALARRLAFATGGALLRAGVSHWLSRPR